MSKRWSNQVKAKLPQNFWIPVEPTPTLPLDIAQKKDVFPMSSLSQILKNNNFFMCLLFFIILVYLSIFMFFVIVQLIPPVLMTPTRCCFHVQVTPPSDKMWVVNQTFTNLDMVYSAFV